MSALNRLYKTHGKTIEFYVVYIREAHAADGARPMGDTVNEPKTFGERLSVASSCRVDLGLKLPMLIDDMKNSTDTAYAAMPDRLFLVDTKGKIAYAGARGPRGFVPAELEAAIKRLLGAYTKPKLSDAKRKEIIERLKARRRAQQAAKKTE